MEDVIKQVLKAEEDAKDIIKKAEMEADKILLEGREKAQKILEAAKKEATESTKRVIEERKKQALSEKAEHLKLVYAQDDKIKEQVKDKTDMAIQAALEILFLGKISVATNSTNAR